MDAGDVSFYGHPGRRVKGSCLWPHHAAFAGVLGSGDPHRGPSHLDDRFRQWIVFNLGI